MNRLFTNEILFEDNENYCLCVSTKKFKGKTLLISKKHLSVICNKLKKKFRICLYGSNNKNLRPYVLVEASNGGKQQVSLLKFIGGRLFALPADGNYLNLTIENVLYSKWSKTYRNFNRVLSEKNKILRVDISTDLHPDAVLLIEKKDYHELQSKGIGRIHAWHGYAKFRYTNGDGDYVHHAILKPEGVVDHINHNGLDNRRCNLRDVTQRENTKNVKMRKDNKTGKTGVYKRMTLSGPRYYACIGHKGKTIHLGGTMHSFEEACAARIEAENKYGFHPHHGLKV